MTDIELAFWEDFCLVHAETKNIYIYAEEYSKDFSSILQPIKEQRDALEHIVRSYTRILATTTPTDSDTSYIEKNFSKAKGHLYRAYYDTADIFSIILREKISEYLSLFTYSEIVSVWGKKEYDEKRKYLIRVNKVIADLRIEKDVVETKEQRKQVFDKYFDIIDNLKKIYDIVLEDIYPQLAEKFN